MRKLPKTAHPLVIRTDVENQQSWESVCELIRAPVQEGRESFYAYVEFLDDPEFRNLGKDDLLARVPEDYDHSFLMVADGEPTVLVVDLYAERGRSFRAIPTAIQSIENNLSIGNMDFAEFADSVDADGIFRGFPRL